MPVSLEPYSEDAILRAFYNFLGKERYALAHKALEEALGVSDMRVACHLGQQSPGCFMIGD